MKILLATFWFLPHTGGVDTHLKVLKKGLEEQGHEVDILAHHPDMDKIYIPGSEKAVGKSPILFPLHEMMMTYFDRELPDLDSWARYREIERYVFEMASTLIGVGSYDLIHTHDVISTRAISRVKPAHAAHIATIHGFLMEEFLVTKEIEAEGSIRWKYSFIEEHLGASSADITILPSEWLRREYTNRIGVPGDLLTVIPYGLDTKAIIDQTKAIARENRPDGKTVMICPARLVPYKGQRYLIEALGTLLNERDDFVCWLAGDGLSKAELVSLVEQYRLNGHVQFLGNRKDIFHLYKQADIFVLPTLVENHSLAVMEAQIVGLPVIATRAGGNAELIIPGHTGILVEPRNADQLYTAIASLMRDPGLRSRLSETSKRWARSYWQPRNMIRRTLEVYERALQRKQG